MSEIIGIAMFGVAAFILGFQSSERTMRTGYYLLLWLVVIAWGLFAVLKRTDGL